jgi:(S)-sulfolactate dehydrogenase
MHVVITEFMDEDALARADASIRWTYAPDLVDDTGRCHAALADADGVIVRNRTQVDAAFLAAAPRLRVVGRLGVGLDNIDLTACAARDIAVCPATGANSRSVAEYVIAAALILTRGVFAATPDMVAGTWPRAALGNGGEVAGKTLGLVGFGDIARTVAGLAAPLGLRIAAHDPYLRADHPAWTGVTRLDSVADVLASADIVSLHVPLTPETRHLLDRAALAAMKPGAILNNTARGGIVDEAALCDALRSGHLGGAALDVFEAEPLTEEAAAAFAGVPNLILTPHVAGVTAAANVRVSQITVENVQRALLGTA